MRRILSQVVVESYSTTLLSSRLSRLAEIAPSATVGERVQIGLLPMVLPDLVRGLEQVLVGAEGNAPVKAFAGGLLTYVYNPLDVMPDEDVLGLIDDAMACALGLLQLQRSGAAVLDAGLVGMCEWAAELVAKLEPPLGQGIRAFVENLLLSTQRPAESGERAARSLAHG